MLFHPHLPFGSMFEFPNRSDLLQLIDRPFAGLERFRPMLGPGDDQDDILPDRNFAVSMDDQQFQNAEILDRPFADLTELLLDRKSTRLNSSH